MVFFFLFVFLDPLTPELVTFNILIHYINTLCLTFQIEAHLDTLINEQASYVLTRAGLSYIYNALQQHKPEQVSLQNLHVEGVLHTCQLGINVFAN